MRNDPERLADVYSKAMKVAAQIQAIAPHGDARNFKDVVEQMMKKIDSNIKAGQAVSVLQ